DANGQLKGVFGNSWTLDEIRQRARNHPKVMAVYKNFKRYLRLVERRKGSCFDEKISTLDMTIYRSAESVKRYEGKYVMLVGDANSGMVLERGFNKGLKEAAIAAQAVSAFFNRAPAESEDIP